MPQTLSTVKQDEFLEDIVQTTLDNFSMAWHLVSLLIAYKRANLPLPAATIYLQGQGPPAHIPGTNCGFFAIPVIHMAIFDCRRSLEFFGLTCNHDTNRLTAIRRRRSDDLGIEHFALARVTPSQFVEATSTVICGKVEPIVVDVHKYGNKRLAHSTMSESTVMLPAIRDMSIVLIEAHMRLLFEALGRPRPSINPSPI
jgi:hypothetical protein